MRKKMLHGCCVARWRWCRIVSIHSMYIHMYACVFPDMLEPTSSPYTYKHIHMYMCMCVFCGCIEDAHVHTHINISLRCNSGGDRAVAIAKFIIRKSQCRSSTSACASVLFVCDLEDTVKLMSLLLSLLLVLLGVSSRKHLWSSGDDVSLTR